MCTRSAGSLAAASISVGTRLMNGPFTSSAVMVYGVSVGLGPPSACHTAQSGLPVGAKPRVSWNAASARLVLSSDAAVDLTR